MRKGFLKKGFITFILIAALAGYYAWQIEPHWVKYEQLKLPIKHLPENLEGKTLVQISDIHIGNYVVKDFIKDTFRKVEKINADIIVYTGDFVRLVNHALSLGELNEVMEAAPKEKIQIPFSSPPIIPVSNKNYDQGIKNVSGNRTLYINRGLGHSIPIRFNARPEITTFTLTKC